AVNLALPSRTEWAMTVGTMIPIVGTMGAFLRERSVVHRIVGETPDVREADLATASDHLPRWFVVVVIPFAIPALAALYLSAHWDEMPPQFPTHWGGAGPDRWAKKSVAGAYGALLSGSGMMLAFLALVLGIYYGARRTPQRDFIMKIMVGAMFMLAFSVGA